MNPTQSPSRLLKWSVIVAIVIVLNLFFNYSLSLIYPAPEYSKYCPTEQVVNPPATKQECLAVGGQWTENTFPQDKTAVRVLPSGKQVQVTGYCNQYFTCQKNYDAVNKTYERTVFLVLVVLGIIALFLGLFLRIPDAVTIGLSFGGVLSLVIASIRYWSQAENFVKVLILAIALAALIWVGIKRFHE
jgi:hypothetical protein